MDRETEQCQGPDRRRLLAVSCGATSGLIMHRMALGASNQKAGQEFVETTRPTNARPAKRILIAYASRYGSTGTVAGAIGEVLCGMGHQVDVRLANTVKELTPYQAVIVGSAGYMGKLLPEAADFVAADKDALGRLPTAYFVVCMTMKDDTPQNRAKATAYLDPVRQDAHEVNPVAIGLFPGVVDFSKMSFMQSYLLNKAQFWSHERWGVEVRDGMDDVALALTADAWSRTGRVSVHAQSAASGSVALRSGMVLVTERSGRERPRLPLTTAMKPLQQLDNTLCQIQERFGVSRREWVVLEMEYSGAPVSVDSGGCRSS